MDKLEHYLDQICRSIGGPKSLRQHVRQELREHLLDAAAEHRAAGLSEAAALDRAMEDFGGPEEVRSGLEEAYGHRLLPVVIDKAMQWKEQTMRAKWLWMTWAHLALAGVIALEVLWLTFAGLYLVPKFQVMLMKHGMIDPVILKDAGIMWMASFLENLSFEVQLNATWLLLLTVGVCGLFEWRVRSENKSFIRLSAWGTAAAGLLVLGILTAVSLVIPYQVAIPALGRIAQPFAVQQVSSIDTSIAALEQALAKKNWDSIEANANRASQALDRLISAAPAVDFLVLPHERSNVKMRRGQLKAANECLTAAQQASQRKDAAQVETAMRKFRELYEPAVTAAKGP